MTEQTVELGPGESKVVSFEAIPHEARTYQVSVNGLTGSFDAIVGRASFTGHVTDAETGQALGDVVVEMWEGSTKLASTSTDTSGFYRIDGISVPITVVLKYSKSGYVDTITQPIELGLTDGGLDVELIPLVPTQLVLYYSNPNTGATHWNAWDLDREAWLAEGLPKLVTEGISFIPEKNRLFMVFREAKDAFFDIAEFGPYVIEIPDLGVYTWDARAARLNGISAVYLMNKGSYIKGMVVSQSETNVEGVTRLSIRVLEAFASPGKYFAGMTIQADTTYRGTLAGIEIEGYLQVVDTPLGNMSMYPGFAMTISNITYPGQLPPDYYDIDGSTAMTYNDNGSFRTVAIAYFSKYGYRGIPILFQAFEDSDQRSLIHWGGINYKVGDYGTQSVQKVLPYGDIGYWISISNRDAIRNMTIRVYLGIPTGGWKHAATISSPYE